MFAKITEHIFVHLFFTLFLVLKRWVLLPPWIEFNLNFFRVHGNLRKSWVSKGRSEKKNWVPAQKKIWLVVDLIFKFMP